MRLSERWSQSSTVKKSLFVGLLLLLIALVSITLWLVATKGSKMSSSFKVQEESKVGKKSCLATVGALPRNSRAQDLTVVIPCTARHLSLLKDCLLSISAQHCLPRRIVVGLSETVDDRSARTLLTETCPQIPFTLTVTVDQANAAMNRNRCLPYVDTEYVAFMDADDLMHPQYLSTVAAWLKQYPTDVVYHGFSAVQEPLPTTCRVWHQDDLKQSSGDSGSLNLDGSQTYDVHRGHVTVRSELVRSFPQEEAWEHCKEEDSLWSRTLLENAQSLVCLDLPLSVYVPDGGERRADFAVHEIEEGTWPESWVL